MSKWEEIANIILIVLLFAVLSLSNAYQYVKMGIYKIFKIPCYMHTDHKFGVKTCRRVKK